MGFDEDLQAWRGAMSILLSSDRKGNKEGLDNVLEILSNKKIKQSVKNYLRLKYRVDIL